MRKDHTGTARTTLRLARDIICRRINIMNDDATINELGGKYGKMDRYEARKAMAETWMHWDFW